VSLWRGPVLYDPLEYQGKGGLQIRKRKNETNDTKNGFVCTFGYSIAPIAKPSFGLIQIYFFLEVGRSFGSINEPPNPDLDPVTIHTCIQIRFEMQADETRLN
jgi:hypothetical protein